MTPSTAKTIVALYQAGGKGKSETIREFAKELLVAYPAYKPVWPIGSAFKVPVSTDFRMVVSIGGKIIGVESKGDPNTDLDKRLLELSDKFACDVIICATRTKGDTVHAVDFLCSTRGYQTIWTSPYQIANPTSHSFVNNLKAKQILAMLHGLGIV